LRAADGASVGGAYTSWLVVGWNRSATASPMLQAFQMFRRYCKSRSECCICRNGCTHMLQAYVPNVSSVFSYVYCKCVYLDVAYVLHICCKCFHLNIAYVYNSFKCFSVVFASVLDACFKCFIYHQMYVASAASGCFQK
jgi:hypothetical protein